MLPLFSDCVYELIISESYRCIVCNEWVWSYFSVYIVLIFYIFLWVHSRVFCHFGECDSHIPTGCNPLKTVIIVISSITLTLVLNHRQVDFLFNSLFRRSKMETSKLPITSHWLNVDSPHTWRSIHILNVTWFRWFQFYTWMRITSAFHRNTNTAGAHFTNMD